MKKKKCFVVSGVFVLLTLLLIVLIKTYDVAQIGPMGTSIGCSHINKAVNEFFGINIIWYGITEVFGVLALAVCGLFALLGGIQLIKRKSIVKVDATILKLGGLYAIVIFLYALFEKVIINYRPMIMSDADQPEASFPSSHTMLICVVMGSTVLVLGKYIKNKSLLMLLKAACILIMIITVIGRLVCGVHWFTDITGGILISIALLSAFWGLIEE